MFWTSGSEADSSSEGWSLLPSAHGRASRFECCGPWTKYTRQCSYDHPNDRSKLNCSKWFWKILWKYRWKSSLPYLVTRQLYVLFRDFLECLHYCKTTHYIALSYLPRPSSYLHHSWHCPPPPQPLPLTSWSVSLLPEWIPVSSSDFKGEKSSNLIGGVDGRWFSGLGKGVVAGLEWFELHTRGETGRESLRIDMGEIERILGLSGLCRWSIWSNRPGNEAIWKQNTTEIKNR